MKKKKSVKKKLETKGGRKNQYDVKVKPRLPEIAQWCREGAIDKDIAIKLGIAESTLYKYKLEFTEFSEALTCNKEVANAHVEQALYKNATEKMNFEAQKWWLKNRTPDRWTDKTEVKFENEEGFNINVSVKGSTDES